jgi:hypothetical protein
VRCVQCGNENPDEFAFCLECGSQIGPPPARDPWGENVGQGPPFGAPQPVPLQPPAHHQADPWGGSAAQTPRLVVLQGNVGRSEIPIAQPTVSLGRSSSNDVVLEDSRVSRHHARITRSDDGYVIEDLASRNGTTVDHRSIQTAHILRDGSVIRIGDVALRFEDVHGPPTPAAHAAAPAGADAVPVVFAVSWSPVRCPHCHVTGTMRPIVYGPAATTTAAREAAARGEVVLGGAATGSELPNAECGSCQTRVRILPATPE